MQRAICCRIFTPAARSEYPAASLRDYCCGALNWGPDRLTANQRRDLMEIVEDRYGRSSTLITSQLPTDTWHEVIGEPTFADAILDRIVHNAYRLALDGPSMRKIQAAELEAAVPIVGTTSSTSATTAKGAKK